MFRRPSVPDYTQWVHLVGAMQYVGVTVENRRVYFD